MDRFQQLTIFVAVAEEGGFAAAARRLKMSPPPVTRAITALETRLGVPLLIRTTRFVRVTEAGQRYLEDARNVLDQLTTADEVASGINATPAGSLSITAPQLFGRIHIVPCVVDYLQRYPETQVSLALLDRVVNLLEEGFDVGIRIGKLADTSMRAVPVGFVRTVVCASPDYLSTNGTPKKPEQLLEHTIVSAASSTSPRQWHFTVKGTKATVRVKPRIGVSGSDAALTSATLGFGITRVLSYQVASLVAEGKLKIVLKDYEPQPSPIHIIHREGREVSAKLRAFLDIAVEKLRSDTALNRLI